MNTKTLKQLAKECDPGDLDEFPGDPKQRKKLFSPFLRNLEGQRAVYHERFVAIVSLSEVKLSEEGFSAVATIELTIEQAGRFLVPPRRPWKFGGAWENLLLSGSYFHVPYAGWSLWPEPHVVVAIEALARNGQFSEALALCFEPEPEEE